MTLRLTIYGRDYEVPRAIEPEPTLCQFFDDAIRSQLEAKAAAAGIPKVTVERRRFGASGEYLLDDDGAPLTTSEEVWTELPDALHAGITVPTEQELLAPLAHIIPNVAPAPAPAPPAEG